MSLSFDRLAEHMQSFLEEVDEEYVIPETRPEDLRQRLSREFDWESGRELIPLIDETARLLRRDGLHTGHRRYFGYFNPSVHPAAVAADALVAAYNPQLAVWAHSPAGHEIERHTLAFLLDAFGLDSSEDFGVFTNGGSEANMTAVITALTHQFPEFSTRGLRGLDAQPVFYISDCAHDSFVKIAHSVGLGRNAVRRVPVRPDQKMEMRDLAQLVEADRSSGLAPFMLVGTAGTTSAGVVDPLPTQAKFAASRKLWFHVDAAWGGAAVLSDQLGPSLSGIEAADSITCDPHKWFSVTNATGMFLCRHPHSVGTAFRVDTDYMPPSTAGIREPYTHSLQWSRRLIGLRVFMVLAQFGRVGFARILERQSEMGEILRRKLRTAGWIVVNETNLPVVCFSRPEWQGSSQLPEATLERVLDRRRVWISSVRMPHHGVALRACITSFKTDETDLDFLVRELEAARL